MSSTPPSDNRKPVLYKEEVFRKLDEHRHKVMNDKELTEL